MPSTRDLTGELELELIQTQMTQKPMLRAEVYALKIVSRMCVESRKFGNSPLSKADSVHEINLRPALSPFCVCFCVEEGAPLLRLLGAPSQKPPLLLRRNPSVALGWP